MRDAPETRASLILRLRNRDDLNAWQEFAEIYQPLVFRLARNKGFQHSDAADIAQEVLVRVAGAIERWDPDTARGSFRGWLYRISRNLMINFLERARQIPSPAAASGLVQLLADNAASSSDESKLFDAEFRRQVFLWAAERVQSAFEESTWRAFWLTAVEDRPVQAVAEQLELSKGAVYVARSRVMQRLRREVQRVVRNEEQSEVPDERT